MFSFLLSIFPSIRVFSNELAIHIKWPKLRTLNYFSVRVSPRGSLIHLISHNFKYMKENVLDTLCSRHPVTPLRSQGGMNLPLPPKVIKVGTPGCQGGHCPEGKDLHPLAQSPPRSVSLCSVIIGKKSSHPSAPRLEHRVVERRPGGPGH